MTDALKCWYTNHNMGSVLVWLFYSPILFFCGLYYLLLLFSCGADNLTSITRYYYPVWNVWIGAILAIVSMIFSVLMLIDTIQLYHKKMNIQEN